MNKFNLQEEEKNRILSMHKALIKEQVTPEPEKSISDQLQEFITNGCVKNGKVVKMNSTNPQKQYAIKQESTKTPGKFRYFFIDYTVGMNDETGKFQILPNKWECNTAAIEATNAAKAAQAAVTSAATASSNTNIANTKKEGDFKTKEELLQVDTEQNIENPVMYEKKVVNGVTLYRRKVSGGIGSALTKDQQDIVAKWEAQGGKLRKDLDPEQAKIWVSRVVSPASEGYFSQDLIMYFDPNQTIQGVGTGETKTNITTEIQKAVNSRIPTDQKDCKKTIEAYYVSFKKKRPLEPNEFEALKYKTQACKNEFYGDWGVLGGGNKMDKILDIMSGGVGGPSRRGEDAKWKLN